MLFTEVLNPDLHRHHGTKFTNEEWRRTGAHNTSKSTDPHVPAATTCRAELSHQVQTEEWPYQSIQPSIKSPIAGSWSKPESSRSQGTTYAISLTFLLASSYFQIKVFPKPDVVSSYLVILCAFLYTNLSSHPLNSNKLLASTTTFGSEFLVSTTSCIENISFCLL